MEPIQNTEAIVTRDATPIRHVGELLFECPEYVIMYRTHYYVGHILHYDVREIMVRQYRIARIERNLTEVQ